MKRTYLSIELYICILFTIVLAGCKKLVAIDPPISSITTQQVFNKNDEAIAAMAGVYTMMINGTSTRYNGISNGFATGLTTLLMGKTADELRQYGYADPYVTNQLTPALDGNGPTCWSSAYSAIYGCNALIEGVAASTSGALQQNMKKELTAEAKFVRAFCYLYLTNYFGDVPLVLTVDFNKTANMARTPKDQVIQQVVQDLKDAQSQLAEDFSYGHGERIVPNKYAATALLARVYLYTGKYADAAAQAGIVIDKSGQYNLVPDLDNVFLANSPEAIWQLQQSSNVSSLGTATPEGAGFIPYPDPNTGSVNTYISPELLNSFEQGDHRRQAWIDSTDNSYWGAGGGWFYYPFKYKTGGYNAVVGGTATEYYMVLRLAEQYLIRAEAEAKGAAGGDNAAIADLNMVRSRAGLPDIPVTITHDDLWKAIAHERQDELFCEWGHRWLDLIRMGLAHNVLSAIPIKQPWAGDYHFLFPVPAAEIAVDRNLTQNPGYTN